MCHHLWSLAYSPYSPGQPGASLVLCTLYWSEGSLTCQTRCSSQKTKASLKEISHTMCFLQNYGKEHGKLHLLFRVLQNSTNGILPSKTTLNSHSHSYSTWLATNHNDYSSSVRFFFVRSISLYLHETLFTNIQHKCINTKVQL